MLVWLWTRRRSGQETAVGSELGCHFRSIIGRGENGVGVWVWESGKMEREKEEALLPFGSAEQGFVKVWSVAIMQTVRRYLLTSGLRSSDLGIPRCGLSLPANHAPSEPPKPTVLRAAVS